eukprot:SAG22_NODE_28_length_28728_cov_19.603619_6_plen_453_part_00
MWRIELRPRRSAPAPWAQLVCLGSLALQLLGHRDVTQVRADDIDPLPSMYGCTTTRVGCLSDSCGDDCGTAPRVQARIMDVFASGPCGGWQESCPSPAVACGCGVCTASADTPCPEAVGKKGDGLACPSALSEPCKKSDMSQSLCLGICSALGQRYFALEAGSQCFCGQQIRNQAGAGSGAEAKTACLGSKSAPSFPKGCTGSGADATTTGCACTGKPAEVCGGYRWLEAYEIHGSCTDLLPQSSTAFSTVLLLSVGLYIGLGVGWGRRIAGRGQGGAAATAGGGSGGGGGVLLLLAAHPHFQQWKALAGLCGDGIAFARARSSGSAVPTRRTDALLGGAKADPEPGKGGDEGAPRRTGSGIRSSKDTSKKKKGSLGSSGKSSRSKSSKSGGGGGGGGGGTPPPPPPAAAAAGGGDDRLVEREERLLQEQRAGGSVGLHSSQAKIKVVSLAL